MAKLLFGVGVNDADYVVQPSIEKKRTICPFYQTWRNLLYRCYSPKIHKRNPTYVNCSVCDDWKIFSNFKSWMSQQDWIGKQLDKDLLYPNNKLYSPETCAFVQRSVNMFVVDNIGYRGNYLIGASLDKVTGKFSSNCSKGRGKYVWLGRFETELEAHLAWKAYKHQLACKLADEETDLRVAAALRQRYL